MKKRKLALVLAAALMGAALISSTAMAEEETVRSYLTGKPVPASIGRTRPIAVMLNNIIDACPQYGLEKADVVYEAEVEGMITRLMGIFEDYSGADRIGSVRSCRPYFIYYAREFNALYCNFGQAIYAVPILQLSTTHNISGISDGGVDDTGAIAYYRSDDRPSPHNVFTDYSKMQAAISACGYSQSYSEGYGGHYRFAEDGQVVTPANGIIARVVMPGYTFNHARFDYNEGDGLYYRSQYGSAQVDGQTGNQVAYKNIILQYCDSTPLDDNGYLWTDPRTGGNGWYITNGRAQKISWSKENWSEEDPVETTVTAANAAFDVRECDFNVTHYYDENGNEITLNQGKTWVCIVRNAATNRVLISDDPYTDSSVIDSIG